MYVSSYYDPNFGIGRYAESEPVFAGYGSFARAARSPMHHRQAYKGYGSLGTPEEVESLLHGVSIMAHPPGTHRLQEPMAYCITMEDIERLKAAFNARAEEVGWTILSQEVQQCTSGNPPGYKLIIEIDVPPPPTGTVYVPYVTPEGEIIPPEVPQSAPEKKNTGLIIGGVVAGLVAVGGIIYMATR